MQHCTVLYSSIRVFAKVNVLNVNDLEPVITLSPVTGILTIGEYEASASDPPFALRLWENTRAGVPLALVQLYDEDAAHSDPSDSEIVGTGLHCELLNYQNHFRIVDRESERHSGFSTSTLEVGDEPLDRETLDASLGHSSGLNWTRIALSIECSDGSAYPKHVRKELAIHVEDVNDSPPTFAGTSRFTVRVRENEPVATELMHVAARDDDLGPNQELSYRIERVEVDPTAAASREQLFWFLIHPTSGELRTNRTFDREQFDRERPAIINVTVLAVDAGTPQLTGTALVSVIVEDVNDCRPQFEPSAYQFEVFENASRGTEVGRVRATDCDVSSEFNRVGYRIADEEHCGFGPGSSQANRAPSNPTIARFEIDRDSGAVRVSGELDRERDASVTLCVVASDSATGGSRGMNAGVALVQVKVFSERHSSNFL